MYLSLQALLRCLASDKLWIQLVSRCSAGKLPLNDSQKVLPVGVPYLGIPAPPWLQGKSFLPVLLGEKRETNDVVFAEVNYHAAYEPKRAARTTRWKYTRRYDQRDHPVLCNCDVAGNLKFWERMRGVPRMKALRALSRSRDCGTKDYWIQHGWARQPVFREELYDLLFDANEENNLVNSEAHEGVLEKMQRHLSAWMEVTNDPLLKGPVNPPKGACLNSPNDVSPLDPHMIVQ